MKRMAGMLVVALVVALPALALAEQSTAAQGAKSSTEKTLNAQGTVTAVAPDSLSVKGKGGDWTFVIDKTTVVVAKGATHKTLELKAEGKSAKLTDFVKVGDQVTVNYHDGATKHAANIRVTAPAK
jgi:hypothetical protein